MRTRLQLIITHFIFAGCVILSACGNKNHNTGELRFKHIQSRQTTHMLQDKTKPACHITVRFEYPAKSSINGLKDSLLIILTDACFDLVYNGQEPSQIVETYITNYTDKYLRTLEPVYLQDTLNMVLKNVDAWYNYYHNVQGDVALYQKDLLVYHIQNREYTDNSQGLSLSKFINIDLRQIKRLKLGDLFKEEDYLPELTELIWEELIENNHVKSKEDLLDLGYGDVYGQISPTENFHITPKGVSFYYNSSEIAPYTKGPVEVTLPYSKINALIHNQYRR